MDLLTELPHIRPMPPNCLATRVTRGCDSHSAAPSIPPASDRSAWERIAAAPVWQTDVAFVRQEVARLKSEYPEALRLTEYLDFFQTGERFAFENRFYLRRHELALLVMAECLDYQGEFIPMIADRIWQICEETSWCIPAAAMQQREQPENTPPRARAIPGTEQYPFPDLFACETAATLGQALQLLRGELQEVSHAIPLRIQAAAKFHVFDSFLANDHYQWVSGLNNWSPWCSSSILIAAESVVSDAETKAKLCDKACRVMCQYLDHLPPDGFPDEGPSYAYVSLRGILYGGEALRAQNRTPDFYHHERLKKLTDAFVAMHLGGGYLANFGPCSATGICTGQAAVLQTLAERIHHDGLARLSREFARDRRRDIPSPAFHKVTNAGGLIHMAREFFWFRPPGADRETSTRVPLAIEFPESQVAFLRENEVEQQGWVCAIKGGHNNASHNHNDVGHFLLLRNQKLLVCDVGRGVYHRDSWGSRRYEEWNLRGSAHNAPVVNRFEQAPGREHAAAYARLFHEHSESSYLLNLTPIYPAEANAVSVLRTLSLQRTPKSEVILEDEVVSTRAGISLEWNFFTPEQPEERNNNAVFWSGDERIDFSLEAPQAGVEILRIELTDPWLKEAWGDLLWQIRFRSETTSNRGLARFRFRTSGAVG